MVLEMETRSKSKRQSSEKSKTGVIEVREKTHAKKNTQDVNPNRADNRTGSNKVSFSDSQQCNRSCGIRVTRRSVDRQNPCVKCVASDNGNIENDELSCKNSSCSSKGNSIHDNVSDVSRENRDQSIFEKSESPLSEISESTLSKNRKTAVSENKVPESSLSENGEQTPSENKEHSVLQNRGPSISKSTESTIREIREETISGNIEPAISENRELIESESPEPTISESKEAAISEIREPSISENREPTTSASINKTTGTQGIGTFESDHTYANKNLTNLTDETWNNIMNSFDLSQSLVLKGLIKKTKVDASSQENQFTGDEFALSGDKTFLGEASSLTSNDTCSMTKEQNVSGKSCLENRTGEFCGDLPKSTIKSQEHLNEGSPSISEDINHGKQKHNNADRKFDSVDDQVREEYIIFQNEQCKDEETLKHIDNVRSDMEKDTDQYEDSCTGEHHYDKNRDETLKCKCISVDFNCAGKHDSSGHEANLIKEYCDTLIQNSLMILKGNEEMSVGDTEKASTSYSPLFSIVLDEPAQTCSITDFIEKLGHSVGEPGNEIPKLWYIRVDRGHASIVTNNTADEPIHENDHFDLATEGTKGEEPKNKLSVQSFKTSDVSENKQDLAFPNRKIPELEIKPSDQEKTFEDLWSAVEEDLASNSYESLEDLEDECGWRPELDNILQGNRVNNWSLEDLKAFEAVDPSLILDVVSSPIYQIQFNQNNSQLNLYGSQGSGELDFQLGNSLDLSFRTQVYEQHTDQNFAHGGLDSSGSSYPLSDDSSSTLSCIGDNCYDSDIEESLSLSCLYESYDSSDESDSCEDELTHLTAKQLSPIIKTVFTPVRAQLSTSGIEPGDFLFLENDLPSSCLDQKLQQEWGIRTLFDVDDVFPYQNMSKDVFSDYSDKPKFKAYDHSFFTVERRQRYQSPLHQGYHSARKASPTLQSASRRSRHASVPGTSSPTNSRVSRTLFLQDSSPSNARGISPYGGGTWRKQFDFEIQYSDSDDLADLSIEDTVDFFINMSSPMKSRDDAGE